jgi:hypothetical protein
VHDAGEESEDGPPVPQRSAEEIDIVDPYTRAWEESMRKLPKEESGSFTWIFLSHQSAFMNQCCGSGRIRNLLESEMDVNNINKNHKKE